MNKAYSGGGQPTNEFLGPGAIYFNYGLPNELLVGVTKGGNEFNDNAEFREREADADIAPVKGARDLVSLRPQLTVRSLKINAQNLTRYYAGMKASAPLSGKMSLRRTVDLSSSYIENVAWVGQNRLGNNMAVLVKNALGDNALNISANKAEEIVSEIVFTAHVDPATFDPEDASTYPYEIIMEAGTLTFTVEDKGGSFVDGALVELDDGQSGVTDNNGIVTFDCTYGLISYTVSDGSLTYSGVVTVDSEMSGEHVELGGIAPVIQTVSVTVDTGASGAGTLVVTVTAEDMSNSPVAVNVALAGSEDAAAVAAKIRAAFVLESDVYDFFEVGGLDDVVELKTRTAAQSDPTMDIDLTDADGTGVTFA